MRRAEDHNHLHFIVEADTKLDLQRGMQGLAISAAKKINAVYEVPTQ